MRHIYSVIAVILALSMLCACSPQVAEKPSSEKESSVQQETVKETSDNPDEKTDVWVNPTLNEYTLKRMRMVGRGTETADYKIGFFEPEKMEGIKGFILCYSVEEFDKVWEYLSKLSYDEIMALDKPANLAYIITDLSYCDGVGNTLNTDQKDIITGEEFTEAGTHYFYAATFGSDGVLSMEIAPQTAYISPTAGDLMISVDGSSLQGSFNSPDEEKIQKNFVFLSHDGYVSVKESLAGKSRQDLDALCESGCALGINAGESTEFTMDLGSAKTISGEALNRDVCAYAYVASASDKEILGVSYCDKYLITPETMPASSGIIAGGKGIVFPNGGAAQIGAGRSSIISVSQAIFKEFPDKPRVALIGGSSGTEKELWSYFHVDNSSKKSFLKRFADAGFEAVYIPLSAENRDTIGSDPYFASLVSSCHGVYFTGGDQSLGMYSLLSKDGSYNLIGQAVLDVYQRGGFLAGTSAGAHMLGNVCFQDADSYGSLTHTVPTRVNLSDHGVLCGSEGAVYDGIPCIKDAAGTSVTFDSHFGARGRIGRLSVMQGSSGAEFAVGLDEATGIAVSDGVGTVYGAGSVTVLDNSSAEYTTTDNHFGVKNLHVSILSAGDKYDFINHKMIPSDSKTASEVPADVENKLPEDLLASDSSQARAIILLAESQEKSSSYKIRSDGTEFTAVFNKTDEFAFYTGQRNYQSTTLSDLPLTAATGITLDIE